MRPSEVFEQRGKMRFSTKGIGWLIFGVIVCLSSTESDDIPGIASTIALGLVFIAIYLMKQRFDPKGIGWFIAGGGLLAFCLDELLSILGGFVLSLSILPGDLSDMLIGFIVAAVCLYMFYRTNKYAIDDVADDMGVGDEFEFPYQQEVFREETVEETVETTEEHTVTPAGGTASDDVSVVEIEVTGGK